MPIITIEMWEGRDKDTKRKLVEKLTQATCEVLGCPKQAVTIVIYDIPKHNWAQEGKLASEEK
ncbi:MAG: 4-oxalocrotonate tautomerase [Elusimicrobiota bacterium]|nr:4-oxalocrotonate tautomerase [Endomicrobiia bacterium]MDW8166633.1 4-oxalocrotonate tautomerase [Elusimicrobiota bacterium]